MMKDQGYDETSKHSFESRGPDLGDDMAMAMLLEVRDGSSEYHVGKSLGEEGGLLIFYFIEVPRNVSHYNYLSYHLISSMYVQELLSIMLLITNQL